MLLHRELVHPAAQSSRVSYFSTLCILQADGRMSKARTCGVRRRIATHSRGGDDRWSGPQGGDATLILIIVGTQVVDGSAMDGDLEIAHGLGGGRNGKCAPRNAHPAHSPPPLCKENLSTQAAYTYDRPVARACQSPRDLRRSGRGRMSHIRHFQLCFEARQNFYT
jgi:hypothetical protein